MFVHIADGRVGLRHLGNLTEILPGVPLGDTAHLARSVLPAGTVVKLTVERMAVSRVGDHHRTVGRSLLTRYKARAGHRLDREESRQSQKN